MSETKSTADTPRYWMPAIEFYGEARTHGSIQMVGVPFCPDLLRYEQIGAADNLRGRVVRMFFWLMRGWK